MKLIPRDWISNYKVFIKYSLSLTIILIPRTVWQPIATATLAITTTSWLFCYREYYSTNYLRALLAALVIAGASINNDSRNENALNKRVAYLPLGMCLWRACLQMLHYKEAPRHEPSRAVESEMRPVVYLGVARPQGASVGNKLSRGHSTSRRTPVIIA